MGSDRVVEHVEEVRRQRDVAAAVYRGAAPQALDALLEVDPILAVGRLHIDRASHVVVVAAC
eukprot:4841597-Lingulodinium_polyedra.AAC.1